MPRISKKFGYIPDLPNNGSPLQTPSTLLVDVHYAKLLLVERWTWERFTRLCAFLRISEAELASAVLMPHKMIPVYKQKNKIPNRAGSARPIALLLTLLEHHCMGAMTKDTIANPFPSFQQG
jgi:hypothetical protein